jgi:hypothetical protein
VTDQGQHTFEFDVHVSSVRFHMPLACPPILDASKIHCMHHRFTVALYVALNDHDFRRCQHWLTVAHALLCMLATRWLTSQLGYRSRNAGVVKAVVL